jgi:hypothetical protein
MSTQLDPAERAAFRRLAAALLRAAAAAQTLAGDCRDADGKPCAKPEQVVANLDGAMRDAAHISGHLSLI